MHAAPDEIAVTASVSAGLNALASALQFTGPRNKVVVSDFEFPTNAQIWHAQEPRGAKVVHVPRAADGYIPAEMFEKAIDEQRSSWRSPTSASATARNSTFPASCAWPAPRARKVLLDCYQSVGSLDIDVKALDVDFAAGGMLKYLLGTAGIGFLYARDSCVRSLVPTNSGWFAQANIARDGHHRRIVRRRTRAASKPARRPSSIAMPPKRVSRCCCGSARRRSKSATTR